ncbi:phosphatidylinositol-4-phosphate 5-kinase-like protein [Novymonas esmeraldas]|uniref:Phosphatidylinositol-4-phosphate 5-kinase-like protein n=1 Tax=Novymonas esmeraldas TaxID=1808958 RepID=A0AAW0EUM7_9TRYP
MGQGGAATSGRGLTALQVAAALKAAAAVQLGDAASAAAVSSPTLRRTRSGVAEHSSAIKPEDCSAVQELTAPSSDAGGARVDVRVTEYAPSVFHFVRQVEGVADAHFADEWSLPEERLRMELGEGRSQALFLKSKSMAFMCKTIAVEEVQVLLRVLRAYALHISANPSSLLMRFYMLLRVSVGKEEGYILCFNDVFGAATVLHEKWDIKGRVPKPGKYEYFPHLIRRAYEPDPYLIETPKNRDVVVNPAAAEAQQHLHDGRDAVVVKGAEDAQKLSTLHDKDLTRLFWLPHKTRKRLLQQLLSDYVFLRDAGLMDYSLLIGVAYQESKQSRSGKRYVIENMKMTAPRGAASASPCVEVRPASPVASGNKAMKFITLSEFANGVHSLYDQEIYYIGIIDMLTTYTIKKKSANFFKSFLWEQDTLSTVPPSRYAQRITSFTKLIFPSVHGESHGG